VAKGVGLHENRTRIVFNLPLGDIKEEKAANRVLDFLKSQRQADPAVSGFTHSVFRPAVFRGWWWSPQADDWCDDPIVLVFVDLKMDFGDLRLSQKIKELKKTIRALYRNFGKPQEEIWVVAHQVMRFD
jgi:hypothetical protein